MNELNEMKADLVKKLAIMLMSQNKGMNMNDALSVVFNSDTYQKIMDEKAGLYYQSARYVFSFLDSEIKNGKICQQIFFSFCRTFDNKASSVSF